MSNLQQDIDIALSFAKRVKLSATISPHDNRSLQFHQSEEIPAELDNDVKDLLEIALQYYQRSIFTGEYLMADDDPPQRQPGKPIEDINFYLGYYQEKLIEELKKSFDLDENLKIKTKEDVRKISPYAQAMLDYRKKMQGRKK